MDAFGRDLAADAEEATRRSILGSCRALWRYVTEGTEIDYDALGFCKFPILMLSGPSDACQVYLRDKAAFDAMTKGGYEHYFRGGWDGRVDVHTAEATMMSPTIAMVGTTGSRYRADGSVNSSWKCVYIMQREGGGWKNIGIDSAQPLRDVREWGSWLASVTSS